MPNIYENIKKYLSNRKKVVIIEAGIHRGEDSLEIINMLKNTECQYYGFEPDPRNIIAIKQNGIDKKINFYPFALGKTDSIASFYQSSGSHACQPDNMDWSYSSSLKKPKLHLIEFPKITFNNVVNVPIMMLDTFCKDKKIEFVDFIWLDVQGAEKDVLEGASEILKKTEFIFFEYYNTEMYENQPKLKDIFDILGKNWTIIEQLEYDVFVRNNNIGG